MYKITICNTVKNKKPCTKKFLQFLNKHNMLISKTVTCKTRQKYTDHYRKLPEKRSSHRMTLLLYIINMIICVSFDGAGGQDNSVQK